MRIRSYSFFYCLPVRLGVFVLTLFGLVGGVIVAATGWLQVSQLQAHPLAQFDNTALYFHTSVFTLVSVVSILGLVAAVMRRPSPLKAYGYTLGILFGITIASGSVTLFSVYRAKDYNEIIRCENGSTDPLTVNVCKNGLALFKGTAIAIYLVTWAWLGYACVIVASYVAQLQEEEEGGKVKGLANRFTSEGPIPIRMDSGGGDVKVMGMPIGPPEPLMMYNSMGAPGINNGYAFSHVPVQEESTYGSTVANYGSSIGQAV